MISLQVSKTVVQWVKHFALSYSQDYPKTVSIVCETSSWFGEKYLAPSEDKIAFCVENGGWSGVFHPKRNVICFGEKRDGTPDEIPAFLIWAGSLPKNVRNYNDIVDWVQKQVDSRNILECIVCGIQKKFDNPDEAFDEGWDAPPHFSYVCCDKCSYPEWLMKNGKHNG